MNVVVTGAGGFIGGHLVKRLLSEGHEVTAVDIKLQKEWFQHFHEAYNRRLDLRDSKNAHRITWQADRVYNLAASMGGMGYIESHKAECMCNVLINTHLLNAAREVPNIRYFFASSACVYAADKQSHTYYTHATSSGETRHYLCKLKESDAYPAMPEDGYGWEKLFSERMCQNFMEDYGTDVRVARLHNVYGPHGTWSGGREKAPAAICRKVIEAKLKGDKGIEIWGDGSQVRSFMSIEDCITGILLMMNFDYKGPVNIGSSESVTVNQLVDVVEEIADVRLHRVYNLVAPRGVIGRSSDNTLIKMLYNWEPSTKLRDGMERLYAWIYDQMK